MFMKYFSKIVLVSFLAAAVFTACKKDENKIYLEGGTAPVLTASSNTPMVLDKSQAANFAIRFNWTNPNYQFTTGISSHDVTYTLQFDTAGANFTSPGKQESVIANELSSTLTVKDLNGFLSKMELKDGVQYNMQIRVKTTLAGGSVPLYSNVIPIKITPYLDFAVEPPGTPGNNYDDGNLWVTGNCFPSPDWANPLPSPYDVSLKFTKVDKLHYELIANFDNTGGYKLIQIPGNWATQYHAMVADLPLAGDFEKRDADPQFASPGTGRYKIEVNFQTGKYKLTPQ
jgi:starch-binding outer membrane protein SusE/F